jgi:hypothetical protein
MGEVIDIDHVRRARRLLAILVERFGVRHYLEGGSEASWRIDPARVDDAVSLAIEWITRRSGSRPGEAVAVYMQRELRRILILRVAEGLLRAGF